MELSYSELNEIYLVAQVNEAEVSADYKKAIGKAKNTIVYRTQPVASRMTKLMNNHNIEPGYKWIACKAHVYTESKLQLENAKLI